MTDEELVKRLRHRGTYNEVFDNADWDSTDHRIEALTAERDVLKEQRHAVETMYHTASKEGLAQKARADKVEAERDRLREALAAALYAWDIHQKFGFQMAGWWVHDASAVLKGDTK